LDDLPGIKIVSAFSFPSPPLTRLSESNPPALPEGEANGGHGGGQA
jgi:hypothetical protein